MNLKTAFPSFSLCLIYASCEALCDNTSADTDAAFREALTYRFAYRLYWMPYLVQTPVFKKWGGEEEGSMALSLGKTISGKLVRRKNLYCTDFGDSMPPGFRYFSLMKNSAGKWEDALFDKGNGPTETISEHYEFKIPLDFLAISSKFDNDAKPILENLKTSLDTLANEIDDAPIGENHFFVGPFSKCVFHDIFFIYWVEKKEILRIKPMKSDAEIEKWNAADFKEETLLFSDTAMFLADNTLQDSPEEQLEKSEITSRLSYSNAIVANCVRDGKLITVVKRPPSRWSKFNAWLKSKFKRSDAQDGR